MNPILIAELQNAGVECTPEDSPEAVVAALQQRIIRLVTSPSGDFDHAAYTRLMRAWEELTAEQEGEEP
jgi:hypothetical protein